MQIVRHEYDVAEAYLPYIINGDASGLEEHEISQVDEFIESIMLDVHESAEPLDFMHFACNNEEASFARCCVSRLFSNTAKLIAVFAVV